MPHVVIPYRHLPSLTLLPFFFFFLLLPLDVFLHKQVRRNRRPEVVAIGRGVAKPCWRRWQYPAAHGVCKRVPGMRPSID